MHVSVLLVITTDESSSLWNISRESLEKITQAFSRYSSCFMGNVQMGRTSGRRKVDRPRDFCEAKNAIICGVSKKVTGSIAIDLSKAFDSICHNLLLAKLRTYGVFVLVWSKVKSEGQRSFLGLATGVLWRSSRQPPGATPV